MFQKKQKADLVPEQFYSVLYAIHKHCQKQLFEIGVFKVCNIHQKTPALEPFPWKTVASLKRDPSTNVFPWKLAKMATRCHSLSLVVIHCHSLSLVVTRCLSLYHSLPLVVLLLVIRCQSLSFVVTRCTTRCHSLPLDVSLACLFINDRLKS